MGGHWNSHCFLLVVQVKIFLLVYLMIIPITTLIACKVIKWRRLIFIQIVRWSQSFPTNTTTKPTNQIGGLDLCALVVAPSPSSSLTFHCVSYFFLLRGNHKQEFSNKTYKKICKKNCNWRNCDAFWIQSIRFI